ncbi:MAG: Hsp33 family molecular chaperone HslO [Fusobacteriaceae bacterium]|jgi:molecular chaperone Hsp33|nr:Hsp33 family molecular chaperone HslO [Fusobacteriaceae bacterium]
MGKLIRGISKNARFVIVDTTSIVEHAKYIHGCAPTALDAFGRVLTAGIMMGSYLKGEDLVTIKTESDGPLKSIIITANAKNQVKGYLSDPLADLPLKDNGKHNVSQLVGKGTIKIFKDMGLKKPYVGISELVTGGIAEDLAYYYFTSEQTPTVISLDVHLDYNNTIVSAGGYMVQLLPDADEAFAEALERKIKAIKEMTELLEGKMSLFDIADLLYDDMESEVPRPIEEFQILEEKYIEFACNCNKDKFYKGLIALGKDELKKIFYEEKEKKLEVECQFCRAKYEYFLEDFKNMLEESK